MNRGFYGFSAPASSGLVLIGEVAAGGFTANIDITGIPEIYKNLVVDFIGRSKKAAVTNAGFYLYFNLDFTATNYRRQIYYNVTLNGADDNSFIGTIPAATATAGEFAHYRITILDYANTLHFHYAETNGIERRAATEHYKWWGYVCWENKSAIHSIRFVGADDNLVEGSVMRVWGEG